MATIRIPAPRKWHLPYLTPFWSGVTLLFVLAILGGITAGIMMMPRTAVEPREIPAPNPETQPLSQPRQDPQFAPSNPERPTIKPGLAPELKPDVNNPDLGASLTEILTHENPWVPIYRAHIEQARVLRGEETPLLDVLVPPESRGDLDVQYYFLDCLKQL